MRRSLFLLLFSIAILSSSTLLFSAPKSRLQHLNHRIANVKASLNQDQSKRDRLQQQLKRTEMAASVLSLKLSNTRHALKKQRTKLHRLQNLIQHDKKNMGLQQQQLAIQLRHAYRIGRQPCLKILLNQHNPNDMQRILTYYHYINQNRIQTIHQLQVSIQKTQNNQHALQTQYQNLKQLNQKQQTEKANLRHMQRNRRSLIQRINNSIHSKSAKLTELLANKHHLEQTLSRLERYEASRPFISSHFGRNRGKLPWPTKGRVLNYFGTKIDESELRWGGILIKAPEGQPIYAIAPGKVVFAKWLAGYGLLLIINHGNGYMTLYGRNQNLYTQLGATVKAGQLIATVGQTGGYEHPSLYFAIRHNDQPLNPTRWCTRQWRTT